MKASLEGFEQWLYKNTTLKDSSIRQYLSQAKRVWSLALSLSGKKDIEPLNQFLIKEYREKNSNTLKPAVIWLLKYLRQARHIPYLVKIPNKPRKRLHHWLKKEELQRLINAIDNIQLKLIVSLLAETGARAREIISLKRDTIDLKEGAIMYPTKTRKTMIKKIKDGTIQPEKTQELFENYVKNYLSPFSRYLFLPEGSSELKIRETYNRFQRMLNSISERILSKKISFHDIRRSIAEIVFESEKNSIEGLRKASKYLGHANVSITFTYLEKTGSL